MSDDYCIGKCTVCDREFKIKLDENNGIRFNDAMEHGGIFHPDEKWDYNVSETYCGNCNSSKLYHDKWEEWYCPWCEG